MPQETKIEVEFNWAEIGMLNEIRKTMVERDPDLAEVDYEDIVRSCVRSMYRAMAEKKKEEGPTHD